MNEKEEWVKLVVCGVCGKYIIYTTDEEHGRARRDMRNHVRDAHPDAGSGYGWTDLCVWDGKMKKGTSVRTLIQKVMQNWKENVQPNIGGDEEIGNEQWQYSVQPVKMAFENNLIIWITKSEMKNGKTRYGLGLDIAGGQDPSKRRHMDIPKEVFDSLLKTGLFKKWQ